MMLKALRLAAVLLAAGCTNYETVEPRTVTAQVETRDSKFDDEITFVGPYIGSGLRGNTYTLLRSWLNQRTREVRHQAYVRVWYTTPRGRRSRGWRNYWTASFVGGRTVEVLVIDDEIDCNRYGCYRVEVVGVPIDDGALRQAQAGGLEFRLNSQEGYQNVVRVPGPYIRGFLARIDGARL